MGIIEKKRVCLKKVGKYVNKKRIKYFSSGKLVQCHSYGNIYD